MFFALISRVLDPYSYNSDPDYGSVCCLDRGYLERQLASWVKQTDKLMNTGQCSFAQIWTGDIESRTVNLYYEKKAPLRGREDINSAAKQEWDSRMKGTAEVNALLDAFITSTNVNATPQPIFYEDSSA